MHTHDTTIFCPNLLVQVLIGAYKAPLVSMIGATCIIHMLVVGDVSTRRFKWDGGWKWFPFLCPRAHALVSELFVWVWAQHEESEKVLIWPLCSGA